MIPIIAGPLANDMRSLRAFMTNVIGARPAKYDPFALDVPWKSTVETKPKLRLGVLPEDTRFPLHPTVKQALADASQLLQTQGHELVYLQEEECHIAEVFEVAWNSFGLDSTAAQIVTGAGEPFIPSILRLGKEMTRLGSKWVPDLSSMSDLEKWSTLMGKKMELTARWHKIWSKYGLDAVISPGAQNTAVEHDTYNFPPYTVLLNLLDVSVMHGWFDTYHFHWLLAQY
jgi:amidase